MLKRWSATIFFRTETGLIDVIHELEELEELQGLVERGPNWDTIEKIEIVKLRDPDHRLTVEAAEKI